MATFRTYKSWKEEFGPETTQVYIPAGAGLNTTVNYIPTNASQSTASNAGDRTQRDSGTSVVIGIDPELTQACAKLKDTHTSLKDLFASIRKKAQAFRSPSMRGAFERELTAGVDGVGRAHAILLPSTHGD